MKIPSKQAIVEVASMLGDRDILYSYVATENDHTVFPLSSKNQANFKIDLIRRKQNYYVLKQSINYQQMAGAALHKEINAM